MLIGLQMDEYQGDLTDILRATSGSLSQQPDHPPSATCWEFDQPLISTSSALLIEEGGGAHDDPAAPPASDNFFGDPFCNMRDPLLHELNMSTSNYFAPAATDDEFRGGASGNAGSIVLGPDGEEVHGKGCCNDINMFSRIQISPAPGRTTCAAGSNINIPSKFPLHHAPPPPPGDNSPVMAAMASPSPRRFKAAAASGLVPSDHIINVNSSKTCLIDNTGPVQISSPRNLGIKRRKSQAKKVVCIPAPAAPNSRPSGEVVPSDLWAWRKYGQKPIKGSPYPRGYYRCSSSKGCSARKQVERSRTDPNMLVITYTSEHNHPWPTQRNALAGSTRSHPPKNNNNNSVGSKTSPASSQAQNITTTTTTSKEEHKESSNDTLSPNNNVGCGASSSTAASSALIKEEVEQETQKQQFEMDQENDQLSEGFSYRPAMPDSSDQDFFADLGEIDGDPLDLLFSQGFNEDDQQRQGNKAALDPFNLFDWSSVDNHSATPFGEAKRGL